MADPTLSEAVSQLRTKLAAPGTKSLSVTRALGRTLLTAASAQLAAQQPAPVPVPAPAPTPIPTPTPVPAGAYTPATYRAAMTSGATVLLAGGDYGDISLGWWTYDPPVNIRAADPSNPPRARSLTITQGFGINVSGLDITGANDPVHVTDSGAIGLDRLKVHGSAAQWAGLLVQASNVKGIRLTNSDLQYGWGGFQSKDCDGVTVADNKFHDLQEDAIRHSGSSNVSVTGNFVTDMFPDIGAGMHPDACQFFGSPAHWSVSNITVSFNLYKRGRGLQVQGFPFIADGAYEDVTVEGNLNIDPMGNGCTAAGCNPLLIKDNVITGGAYVLAGSQNVTNINNRTITGDDANQEAIFRAAHPNVPA